MPFPAVLSPLPKKKVVMRRLWFVALDFQNLSGIECRFGNCFDEFRKPEHDESVQKRGENRGKDRHSRIHVVLPDAHYHRACNAEDGSGEAESAEDIENTGEKRRFEYFGSGSCGG